MIEITIPYKFKPRPYQLNVLKALDNEFKRAVIVWSRRSGKDKTCWNYTIKKAAEKIGTYYYFLPTYSLAKKVVWDNIDNDGFRMLDHVPKELIARTNATELKVELKNGSIIQLIGADEFEKGGVGVNCIGAVFSEFSITDPKAWSFVRPILAANGGWAVFNFTPRGKNFAWDLLQMAKNSADWFWEVLTVDDTQVLTPEALAQEKKEMPAALFNQEYYCDFLEGGNQFFKGIHKVLYPADRVLTEEGDFQVGVDLAKTQDWTVLTPFNANHMIAYPQERFQDVSWSLQEAKIEAMARRFGNALVVPDSTGVGDPIVAALKERGVSIYGEEGEGFKFTEISRSNLLNHLAILIENGKIHIPDDPVLVSELESFQYVLGDTGKVKVQVPQGAHDDCVMSLALAVWGINEKVKIDSLLEMTIMHNRESKAKRFV